tara:strand:- start:70 stop:492 length:423 start_codon:yes stop_codon:yes gene_type:complete
MAYLIDTNVLSEVRKRSANPAVLQWQANHKLSELWVSVINLMEIRNGTEQIRLKDPDFATALDHWYQDRLLPIYKNRILTVTLSICETRANLPQDRTLPPLDALIAATAKYHHLTIVTRNTKDFEGLGLDLINPWETETN